MLESLLRMTVETRNDGYKEKVITVDREGFNIE